MKIVGGRPTIAPPKGRREREVPLPDVVAVAPAEHLRVYRARGDDLVFLTRERNPIERNHFNRYVWKPSLVRTGVEPTRENGFHALRHHYASALLSAGVSIRAVAQYLGHSDPGFTLRTYAHLMPEDEDRARTAIDAGLCASSAGSLAARSRHGEGAPT